MKIKIINLFLLFPLPILINAQDSLLKGKIIYTLEASKSINNTIEMWFTSKNYLYQFKQDENERVSLFNRKKYDNIADSLADMEKIELLKKDIKKTPPQTWYGELSNNIIISSWYNGNTNETYCIKDSLTFMRWELLEDTLTVRGIKCQKAFGKYNGMQYFAWFAPSIPTSVAFMHYRGLPGLLIECTNLTRNTKFGMIELQWPTKEKITITTCSSSPLISMTELNAIIDKQNSKLLQMINNFQDAQKKNDKIKLQDAMKENK